MNALSASGAKCTRLLVILGLAVLLASPAMLLWASRPAARSGSAMSEAEIEEIMLRQDARLIDLLAARIPEPTARPAEHAVFPERLATLAGSGHGKGKGLLQTSLGHLDPQNAEALMREIPQRLLLRPNEITRGERGGAAEGLNYVTLRQEAIAAKSLDAILARLQQDARIVGYLPNASFVVYAEAAQVRGLVQNPDVAFAMPVHPAFKISSDAGRKPFMERARAADANFRLEVFLVPGVEARQVKEALAKMSRVRDVFEAGEAALRVNAHFSALPEIARLKGVSFIQEAPEWVNHNFKEVPLIQVGSGDEGLEIRAFDEAGVDGGGLNAAGAPVGIRVNDGTAQVPPQIVGVTDNGISLDTPSFSQTATQVTGGTPVGQSHRKVHSIQNIVGGGAGCDSVLSGAGTHGNTVASIIAANPTQLGVFIERRQFSVTGSIPRINLDGVARGARILLQDVQADTQSACLVNSIIERGSEVNPGILLTRLSQMICPKSGGTGTTCAPGGTALIGGATEIHLAILPFGIPNWTRDQFPTTNGKYSQEAADVDTFLYNNRDFMVVVPVGNNGGLRGNNRLQLDLVQMPDLFNGTAADEDPNFPKPPQVSPPATAKNIISVGAHRGDCMSFFGNFDCEENQDKYASRGPATGDSRRTAPILVAAGAGEVFAGRYGPATWANIRSTDDDNSANGGQPLDVVLDENNFGTSFSSAGITGAAAIVRDYFAQGMYPTGSRTTGNRVPNVSGALVKAALVASAHFNTDVRTQGQDPNEANLRRTRGMDVGSPAGVAVGVIGNNEVGYGRVVLTQVLPLANWSKTHITGAYGAPNRNVQEHPAAGLLVYDDLATGEPLINNTTTSVSHTFLVNSSNLFDTNGATAGGLAVRRGELRVGLAWPDPPSLASTAAGGGGQLINDLDLTLESPGPDNNLATTADNQLFYGNVYDGGFNNAVTDAWAKSFTTAQPATHDKYNPVEGIHINSDKNNNQEYSDSRLFTGTWRITVARGSGGATPGVITIAPGIPAGPNGEDNGAGGGIAGNRRLDGAEDANVNGQLDLPGQAYALVVAGPAFRDPADAAPTKGPTAFPRSSITLNKIRYSCSDATVASIFDTAGGTAAQSSAATTFTVRNRAGTILDTETDIPFTSGATAGSSSSMGVPVRMAMGPPTSNNMILEADTGQLIFATYSPAGQSGVAAAAQVHCASDIIPNFFLTQSENAFSDQFQINGGCDFDKFLDDSEVVTYGIALANRSRSNDYMDVVATLTPTGPGAAAVSVLDSPRNVGRLPGAGNNGIFFHVKVDGALMPAAVADRKVTMVLTLDSLNKGQKVATQTYSFTHALHADEDRKHYSTDFPAGGRNVRDLNRNLLIDRADVLDPFLEILYPDEDVTFVSMFVAGADNPNTPAVAAELVSNILGEDLDNDGIRDAGERDVFANGVLDRGILFAPGGPTPGSDKVPWAFDLNDGGWAALRHPASTPGGTTPPPQQWRYVEDGLCGFQTQAGAGNFGIWHTQNGPTPGGATACPNFAIPSDAQTQPLVEMYMDVLHSPIVAKVNQVPDARGFPHTVEFQRLGLNVNEQVYDAYATAGLDIDSNIDDDNFHTFLTQQLDTYYIRLGGGWNDLLFTFGYRYFGYYYMGIDPVGYIIPQRTFGPKVDADNSILASKVFNADDSGFSGFTQDTNPNSFPVIPEGAPDLLAYPVPAAPQPGVCTGNTSTPGAPCQAPGDCGGPSPICTIAQNTVAGPIRNFDTSLVGYEGIDVNEFLFGEASNQDFYGYFPGPTGNRWQVGFSFAAIESGADIPDYGFAFDDVIFEWDEWHPQDEGTTNLACSRFGGIGQAGGSQCASITVDRTNLFDCEESVEITVFDATPPPDSDPAAPGLQLDVAVVTDSDAELFSTFRFTTLRPNAKRYKLTEVAGKPGLFRGNVTFSGVANNPTTANSGNVFTNAGADATFIVYYHDFQCDADRDGIANESAFENLDGDGVADASDNCFLIYNPGQEDTDTGGGDGVGNACDNCPAVSNAGQDDANNDNVGDACEFDDVDGDGVDNGSDNCKDLYNEDQANADLDERGDACDPGTPVDLDGDGQNNDVDNCILTSNGNQRDDDTDLLGSACDGDCRNLTLVRICSNSPATTCTGAPGDPTGCPAGGVCQTAVRPGNPNTDCSSSDDDADADGVPDNVDLCAVTANPAIIPGTFRQADADRDGLGDQCDPTGTLDDDFEGTPDDLVSFVGTIDCRLTQLANFTIVSANYQDLDGDLDIFPDTGETGRVVLTLQNTTTAALPQGFTPIPLTGVTIVMTSDDPDVACISQPAVAVPGTWGANAQITVGSFNPAQPGLTFKSSNSLSTPDAANPARTELCLSLTVNETLGLVAPKCFSLLSDLDTPPGQTPPARILGPDGIPNTPDDGTLRETFDADRNSDGNFTIADTFRVPSNTVPGAFDTGSFLRGSSTGIGGIAVVACGGYVVPVEGNPGCVLDPDFPMDWHFHCPTGATNCPNVESGPCVDCLPGQTTLFGTPTNDNQAFSGPNSMHFGIHVNAADPEAGGDTVHLRQVSAYVTSPINLALLNVAPTELILSFFHIVSLIDNNRFGPGNENQCVDCAQVHAQRDLNPDPLVDSWGTWDVLQPFRTVYEHKPNAWSAFGPQTCVYTPTDTGTAPPAPRGVHETMCYPQGAWSHCGAARGQTPGNVFDCTGAAGFLDPDGTGVWVESRFNLAGLIGQRVRIRWLAETWQRNTQASFGHYVQEGGTVANAPDDDGWWVDNINITGVVTTQFTPAADNDPAPTPGPNSANCAVTCATAVGDNGTNIVLKVTDLNGNDLAPNANAVVAGETIRVSAIDSTLPGGCTNGARQFQFFKDGVLVQDWSSKPHFEDTPEVETDYSVKMRCSADSTCTSAIQKKIRVRINRGDCTDIPFGTQLSCTGGPTPGRPCTLDAHCGAGGLCSPGLYQDAGIKYFRGTCTALGPSVPEFLCPAAPGGVPTLAFAPGTLPCNSVADCGGAPGACSTGPGVPQDAPGVANDTTLLCYTGVPRSLVDAYHGAQGPGITIGQQALPDPPLHMGYIAAPLTGNVSTEPYWALNTNDFGGDVTFTGQAYTASGTVNPPWGTCYNPNPAAMPASALNPNRPAGQVGSNVVYPPLLASTFDFPAALGLFEMINAVSGQGGVLLTQGKDPNPPSVTLAVGEIPGFAPGPVAYAKYYDLCQHKRKGQAVSPATRMGKCVGGYTPPAFVGIENCIDNPPPLPPVPPGCFAGSTCSITNSSLPMPPGAPNSLNFLGSALPLRCSSNGLGTNPGIACGPIVRCPAPASVCLGCETVVGGSCVNTPVLRQVSDPDNVDDQSSQGPPPDENLCP